MHDQVWRGVIQSPLFGDVFSDVDGMYIIYFGNNFIIKNWQSLTKMQLDMQLYDQNPRLSIIGDVYILCHCSNFQRREKLGTGHKTRINTVAF